MSSFRLPTAQPSCYSDTSKRSPSSIHVRAALDLLTPRLRGRRVSCMRGREYMAAFDRDPSASSPHRDPARCAPRSALAAALTSTRSDLASAAPCPLRWLAHLLVDPAVSKNCGRLFAREKIRPLFVQLMRLGGAQLRRSTPVPGSGYCWPM